MCVFLHITFKKPYPTTNSMKATGKPTDSNTVHVNGNHFMAKLILDFLKHAFGWLYNLFKCFLTFKWLSIFFLKETNIKTTSNPQYLHITNSVHQTQPQLPILAQNRDTKE
jgi:hypothetical protein